MKKIEWKTERRKLKDLKPWEGNPRSAGEKEYGDVKKSLDKFGVADPLIINTDNQLLGGHLRTKILTENGEQEVDVRVPSRKLTEAEAKELNLRLNKNQGSWDMDLLANFSEDLLKDVGWESEDLDSIFKLSDTEDDFDLEKELKTTKKTKIKLGDIYQLGKHKLLCADSTDNKQMEGLMGDSCAKLVFTSPPYYMGAKMYENYKDNLKREKYIQFNLRVIENCKKYLKGFIFWNISYNKNARSEFIEIIYKITKETGLQFLELIVWDKGHGLPITSKKQLTRQYEDILLVGDGDSVKEDLELYFCGNNDGQAYFNKKTNKGITNYWKIGTNNSQIENLLACFPVALPIRAIQLMTQRNEIVFDPFLGSGTTMIAAEKTGRICYGMELDPKYVEVAIKRYEAYTGQKSEKIV